MDLNSRIIFYVLSYLLLISFASCLETSTLQYLARRARQVKVEIAKSYYSDLPSELDLNTEIKWEKLWSHKVKHCQTNPVVNFKVFDKMFILECNKIISVRVQGATVMGSSALKEVNMLQLETFVRFVRTYVWKSTLFLLICQEGGTCNLHTGSTNLTHLQYCQTLTHQGFLMDAHFFEQTNHLYLVVADNTGQFSVKSMIYRWTGTYMDIISEITTTGAISVTSFKHKNSRIIIFAQNFLGKIRGSKVFEFKNDEAYRIQHLPTDRPISLHPYVHMGRTFLLVVNEHKPGQVFWWDGSEFLDWMPLREIQSPTLLQVIYVESDVLVIAYSEVLHTLQLFKVESSEYLQLGILQIDQGTRIHDFGVSVVDKTVTLLLILKDYNGIYRVEPWVLQIHKFKNDNWNKLDTTAACMAALWTSLEDKMPSMQASKDLWKKLLSSSENVTCTDPLLLPSIVIKDGTVSNIEVTNHEEIIEPSDLRNRLRSLSKEIDDNLSKSRKVIVSGAPITLSGNVTVEKDVELKKFEVNSWYSDHLNFQKLDFSEVIFTTYDQNFTQPLKAKVINVKNLEVDGLCGVPVTNWAMKSNNSSATTFDFPLQDEGISISGDTLKIAKDVDLSELRSDVINNVEWSKFFDNLFLVDYRQTIKGNVWFKHLQTVNLTVASLNGIQSSQLLTKVTDQQDLEDVFIRSLKVRNLKTDKINGVETKNAAKVNQKNVIKGKVRVANLEVKKEFAVAKGVNMPEMRSLQIYEDVTIVGNVVLKNLAIQRRETVLALDNSDVDLQSLIHNSWSKSTAQTIPVPIVLENGATIDQLNVEYLNGHSRDDYLYSSIDQFPQSSALVHFHDVVINKSLNVDGEEKNWFQVDSTSLTFYEAANVRELTVNNLIMDNYFGIPVANIMSGEMLPSIDQWELERVVVTGSMDVEHLEITNLNSENLNKKLSQVLYVDSNLEIDSLKALKVEGTDVEIMTLNGEPMKGMSDLNGNKEILRNSSTELTVEGDVLVEQDLRLDFINNREINEYLTKTAKDDIVIYNPVEWTNLIAHGNVTAASINNRPLDNLLMNLLYKSKPQTADKLNVKHGVAKNVFFKKFNNYDKEQILFIDDPITFDKDVTFSHLNVNGSLETGTINDRVVSEVYNESVTIPFSKIHHLTVESGKLSWKSPVSTPHSLSNLFAHAVTKTADQTIHEETVFQGNVSATNIICGCDATTESVSIANIVQDAVVQRSTVITGRKFFKGNLVVDNMIVSGDVAIPKISDSWTVSALNYSVVRKYSDDTVYGMSTFNEEVNVQTLEVNGLVHEMPVTGLVSYLHEIPSTSSYHFSDLEIQGNAYLKNLDGIEFDKFANDVITTDGNHVVSGLVQFNGIVTVKDNLIFETINGISSSDFALNGTEATQVISKNNAFANNLIIHGDTQVPVVNGVNVMEAYREGILNDEDIDIYGDVVMTNGMEILGNVSVIGFVNGLYLNSVLKEVNDKERNMLQTLKTNETKLEVEMEEAHKASQYLPEIFFYVDNEETISVQVPNVSRVDIVRTKSVTKLSLIGNESGNRCGLPSDCECRMQYLAELFDDGCHIWKSNNTRIVHNFHEPNGVFSLSVSSNVTSSSAKCTSRNHNAEINSISWMTLKEDDSEQLKSNVKKVVLDHQGFISDAQVFVHNSDVFIILAVFYDPTKQTHKLNSTIYQLDIDKGNFQLYQDIPTDGAKAIEIFNIGNLGPHIVIGCESPSEESLLYAFNPMSQRFELMRSFQSNSKCVKSVKQENSYFVLLNDPATNAVHIYEYDWDHKNFYDYQSFFYEARVNSIETYYAGEFGMGSAFLVISTEDGHFYIYEYMYFAKFQQKYTSWVEGAKTVVPFYLAEKSYLLVGTERNSTVLRLVTQGIH